MARVLPATAMAAGRAAAAAAQGRLAKTPAEAEPTTAKAAMVAVVSHPVCLEPPLFMAAAAAALLASTVWLPTRVASVVLVAVEPVVMDRSTRY